MSKDTSGPALLANDAVFERNSQEKDRGAFYTIAVSIYDASGAAVAATAGSTMALSVRVLGSDQFVASTNTLDLAAGQRSFDPFFESIDTFRLTPSGLAAGLQYRATITSSIVGR